jgi:hypothetical protein
MKISWLVKGRQDKLLYCNDSILAETWGLNLLYSTESPYALGFDLKRG